MASIVFEERISIPMGMSSLDEFRIWARSDEFPESGRIDYISGNIEVDMSPEDIFTHGTLKTSMAATLFERVTMLELGHLCCDSTRVSHPEANLSVEPDIVLITHEAIETGRVTFVSKASGVADRFVEIEGTPELIVEIVSDSSVKKDTQRLLAAYHAAGVQEYWLVDARGEEVSFQINARAAGQYQPAAMDSNGFQKSDVMACHYRLHRTRGKHGYWQYALEAKP